MSSEMREYVAALRDREHRFHGMGGHYVAEVIRGELEDILARTEAGADGVDVREALDDRLDWLKKVSGPAKAFQASNVVVRLSTAEESLRMLFAASLRTHPQDASGDAEDAAMFRWLCDNARPWESDYEEPHALIRICRGEFQGGVGWFNIIGRESRVGVITLRDAVRCAMQAKEAK
jgi:hypothetical protein